MTKVPPLGTRVRARMKGEYPSGRVNERMEPVKPYRWRAVITGRVVAVDGGSYVSQGGAPAQPQGPWLVIAGYGRVEMAACRKARWWQR